MLLKNENEMHNDSFLFCVLCCTAWDYLVTERLAMSKINR